MTAPSPKWLQDEPTALYRLYDASNRLLYVGISSDPEGRWVSHRRTKPWWPDVDRKAVEWHPDRGAAEGAEIRAIETERPLHNHDHSGKVSPATRKAKAGAAPTGPRCYGYTRDGNSLIPDEAASVRDMFDWFTAGVPVNCIVDRLNAYGGTQRSGRPWTHNAVRHVLRNARYAAIRESGGQQYPGTWPPIVTAEQLAASRGALAERGRANGLSTTLLSGIALCGRCTDGTTVSGGSRGASQPLYKCSGRIRHLTRSMKMVNALVEAYIIERLSRPDAMQVLESLHPRAASDYHDAEVLRGRLRDAAREFVDIPSADPERFREVVNGLAERIAEAERQAAILAETPSTPDEIWERLPLGFRRAVVSSLCEVTILPGRPGRAPFDPSTVVITPK